MTQTSVPQANSSIDQREVWRRHFWKELSMLPNSIILAMIQISKTKSEPKIETAEGIWHVWPLYQTKER